MLVFFTYLQTVFNWVATTLGDNLTFNHIQNLIRFQLASEFQMKFKDLQELLGLNSVRTFMDVFEDYFLNVGALKFQKTVYIRQLLVSIP